MIAAEDLKAYSNALAVMWDVRRKIRNQIADNKEVTTSGIDAASLVVLNALRDKTSISRTEILRISNIESHYLCKILRKLGFEGFDVCHTPAISSPLARKVYHEMLDILTKFNTDQFKYVTRDTKSLPPLLEATIHVLACS